jgi:large repetitive protein
MYLPTVLLTLASSLLAFGQSSGSLIYDISLKNAAALKVPPIIDNQTDTVFFGLHPGSRLKVAPTFELAAGVTARPPSGKTIDLSRPQKYSLSKHGKTVETWTFQAVEMNSPALPGLYADPNIIAFNGIYYIYATTDGFVGWVRG